MLSVDVIEKGQVVMMKDMMPLQIGKIVHNDRIVMRTASTSHFEVMDLSVPGLNSCWQDKTNDILVELFAPDVAINIKVNNK